MLFSDSVCIDSHRPHLSAAKNTRMSSLFQEGTDYFVCGKNHVNGLSFPPLFLSCVHHDSGQLWDFYETLFRLKWFLVQNRKYLRKRFMYWIFIFINVFLKPTKDFVTSRGSWIKGPAQTIFWFLLKAFSVSLLIMFMTFFATIKKTVSFLRNVTMHFPYNLLNSHW